MDLVLTVYFEGASWPLTCLALHVKWTWHAQIKIKWHEKHLIFSRVSSKKNVTWETFDGCLRTDVTFLGTWKCWNLYANVTACSIFLNMWPKENVWLLSNFFFTCVCCQTPRMQGPKRDFNPWYGGFPFYFWLFYFFIHFIYFKNRWPSLVWALTF